MVPKVAQLQVHDRKGDCHPLMREAPHSCQKCMTEFNCEDEACTAAYESTCKSCIATGADCGDDPPTGWSVGNDDAEDHWALRLGGRSATSSVTLDGAKGNP